MYNHHSSISNERVTYKYNNIRDAHTAHTKILCKTASFFRCVPKCKMQLAKTKNATEQKHKYSRSKNHKNAGRKNAEIQSQKIAKTQVINTETKNQKMQTKKSKNEQCFFILRNKKFPKKKIIEKICCRRLKILRHMTLHISDCIQYSKLKLQ